MPLATLAQARAESKKAADKTDADDYLLRALFHLSDRIEGLRYPFAPIKETRKFDCYGSHIDDLRRTLTLDMPLLELLSMTDAGGDALTVDTDVFIETISPSHTLRLSADKGYWHNNVGDEWIESISVTGIWGYRRRYSSEGWLDSNDTLGANLNASATALTISNINGADALGRTPRFSPGNLIRIVTDSVAEYMLILSSSSTSNLNVQRAARGTTAAAHDSGATIETWQPDDAINRAVLRGVAYLDARRGSFEQTTFTGVASVQFPPDLPPEVENILKSYPIWEGHDAA